MADGVADAEVRLGQWIRRVALVWVRMDGESQGYATVGTATAGLKIAICSLRVVWFWVCCAAAASTCRTDQRSRCLMFVAV